MSARIPTLPPGFQKHSLARFQSFPVTVGAWVHRSKIRTSAAHRRGGCGLHRLGMAALTAPRLRCRTLSSGQGSNMGPELSSGHQGPPHRTRAGRGEFSTGPAPGRTGLAPGAWQQPARSRASRERAERDAAGGGEQASTMGTHTSRRTPRDDQVRGHYFAIPRRLFHSSSFPESGHRPLARSLLSQPWACSLHEWDRGEL